MKRFLILIVLFLFAAAGCEKETCSQCGETVTLHRVSVAVSCPVVRTKGDDSLFLAESRIERCILYVFDPSGEFAGRYDSADGRFDVYLPEETFDLVAIANKNDLPQAPSSRNALLDNKTTLAENVPGRFVMVGMMEGFRVSGDVSVDLAVSRVVAKVSYTVRTDFSGTLTDGPFEVQDIFLANVAGEADLRLSGTAPAAAGIWYDRLEPDEPYGPVFYACPNDAPDLHDRGGRPPRSTRFVVRAALGDRIFYYPVTLDTIRPNTHYHVDLNIAGYGLEHPEDDPKSYGAVEAVVSVAQWGDGGDVEGLFCDEEPLP